MNTSGPEWVPTVNPQNATHSSCFENTYNLQISDEEAASAEITMAICCEGVFKRYKGVLRRALKVVRQA